MNDPLAAAAFPERADYEKGFSSYYAEHIDPLLDQLEADRLDDFNIFVIAAALGAVAVAVVLLLLYGSGSVLAAHQLQQSIDNFAIAFSKHGNDVGEGKIKILFFAIFLASVGPIAITQRYASEAKTTLLPPILNFFKTVQYFPLQGFSLPQLAPFSIPPYYDTCRSKDSIGGNFDDVQFTLSKIQLVEGSGKNREVVFCGIALILQMNKPFEGKTIVTHHEPHLFGNKLNGLERVTLEDPNFEQRFTAYSSNQVEARYLLTPAFMERLMSLATLMQHWGGDPTTMDTTQSTDLREVMMLADSGGINAFQPQASFYSNQLLLLIPYGGDLFQPGNLFVSAYRINEIRCVLYQIDLIRKLIELLKLNQHIGM